MVPHNFTTRNHKPQLQTKTSQQEAPKNFAIFSNMCFGNDSKNNMHFLSEQIEYMEEQCKSPKHVALLRMEFLDGKGSGFASFFLPMLRNSLLRWMNILQSVQGYGSLLSEAPETTMLIRCLRIYKSIADMDPALSEEVGREGAHTLISKLIKIDWSSLEKEEDQDIVMEIQDMACEIASMSNSFPLQIAPYTEEELCLRLPLSFPILPATSDCVADSGTVEDQGGVLILINQVKERQSAQKDVGFVMWPSAVALSRWLVSNPIEMKDKDILELGAGCGLVGLVAARLVSLGREANGDTPSSVTLTDFNELVVKNIDQNICLNELVGVAKGERLDFYAQDTKLDGWLDSQGTKRSQVNLILASDIICCEDDAFAASRTVFCALRPGGKAIVISADSKHRFGVEKFEGACLDLGLEVSKTDVNELYQGRLLCKEMEKTSGYCEGMTLTMYTVTKKPMIDDDIH